jgi:hypothetical protein
MNRAGDWVVLMTIGSARIVGAGKGATPPSSFSELAAPGLAVTRFSPINAAGIDEAGNTTFSGRDAADHPVTIVRRPDGTLTDYTLLDEAAAPLSDGLKVGVGPQGHAVAVWAGGGLLRWATRLPGGTFGPPTTSGVASDLASGVASERNYGPEWIGVDDQGRTIMVSTLSRVWPAPVELQTRRGTVSAPFGDPVTVTAPGSDPGGPSHFAMGSGGNAVLAWLDTQRYANRVARAAIATDGGPFSSPLRVPIDSEEGELPSVAIDGAGRAVLAWMQSSATDQRVLVAALTPSAVAGPTAVAQGALTAPPPTQGRASARKGQVLRIRADRTVRPVLTCVSPQASCTGTLRIDVRPARGAKRIRLGSHSFLFSRGRAAPVVVRVTRAARRAARRRSLKGVITVTTRVQGAESVAFTDVVGVTVRRTRR